MRRKNLFRNNLEWAPILIAAFISIETKNSNFTNIMFLFLIVLGYSLKFLGIYLASTMILFDIVRFAAHFIPNVNVETNIKILLYFLLFTIIKYTQKKKDPQFIKTITQYWILFIPLLIIAIAPIVLGQRYILEQLFRGYDNVGHLAMMNSLSSCQEFLTQCLNAKNAIPDTYNQYPQQWHILFTPDSGSDIPILFWYWIAITSTLFLSLLIVMKSINFSLQKTQIQPISVFRLFAACSLIIVMWSAGYVNYVFSIALLIMGFALCRAQQFSGLILGTTILGLSIASYTLFIPAIGIWLIFQLLQCSFLGKKEFILLLFYTCVFSFYSALTILNSTKNGQLNALDENSNSWKITLPVMIIIAMIMFKTSNKMQIGKNSEVYAFLFSSILIQLYLFFKNQIGGYFLYKNVIVLLVLFLLSNMRSNILMNSVKSVLRNFRENFTNLTGYEIQTTIKAKNLKQINRTSAVYTMVVISVLWAAVPSNAIPSPLRDFAVRMKTIAVGEMNRSTEILEVVEKTEGSKKPVLYVSSDYYFFTQWIAALNGNWSSTLQEKIDQIVRERGLLGIPDLLDTNPGISTWKPTQINHD